MDMKNYQVNPLKIYIQDIYRAKRMPTNKYIYEIFDLTFKNVMIHGIVTAIYNNYGKTTNLELSDPTGTVQIYYDTNKTNTTLSESTINDLNNDFKRILASGDNKIPILRTLKNAIMEKNEKRINFAVGDYLCVVGDIFVDDMKNKRMVSAFECTVTSVQRDVVWLEELMYIYQKYYLVNI